MTRNRRPKPSESDHDQTVGHLDALLGDARQILNFEVRKLAIRRAILIPRRLGFRMKRLLSLQEKVDIMDAADTSGISEDDLTSFENAAMLILATDDEGVERYVPVEVSYTIYPRHVERVARNAEFLTSWTGLPAHPAVAGIDVSRRAKPAVESGAVYFYGIPERPFVPD